MTRKLMMLAVLATTSVARAQEVNLTTLDDARTNQVYLRTGAEHGFVAGVGYARAVSFLGRNVLLSADLTAPWASLDAHDYRLRAGALIPIAAWGGWNIAASFAPTLRRTKNDLGRLTGIGADGGLSGGYYARRWFVAAELGLDWEATTHIDHSDMYRSNVYDKARSGWYSGPDDGYYRAGVQAGISLGRLDLALRLGQLHTARGAEALLPFYATMACSTRF